ncbi:hypothetical protein SteCoe_14683 [Stentor coeruleus]|uniref:Ion transport domain-containing protein n=1 Tax=Stentor coeruleus TaxID=5963 RepID=A0A1R2C5J4_9CILI|nr:hypothetical protein SteCoe_14683 [Stentor coeruleus]
MSGKSVIPVEFANEKLVEEITPLDTPSNPSNLIRIQTVKETSEILELKKKLRLAKKSIINTYECQSNPIDHGFSGIVISQKHSVIILSNSTSNDIQFFSLENFQKLYSYKSTCGSCFQLKINQDESKVYCATHTGYIFSLDLPFNEESGCSKFQVFKGRVAFCVSGEILYSQGIRSFFVKQYNTVTNTTNYIGRIEHIYKLAINNSGKYLAGIGRRRLQIYDMIKFKYPIYNRKLPLSYAAASRADKTLYSDIVFAHNDDFCAFACERKLTIISMKNWKDIKVLKFPDESMICSIKLTNLSDNIIGISQENSICVWDTYSESILPCFFNSYMDETKLYSQIFRFDVDTVKGIAYAFEKKRPILYKFDCNLFRYKIVGKYDSSFENKLLIVNKKEEILLIRKRNPKVLVYDINSCKEKSSFIFTKGLLLSCAVQQDFENYLYLISEDCMVIYNTESYEVINEILCDSGKFVAIIYHFYMSIDTLILSDNNSTIKFYKSNGDYAKSLIINLGNGTVMKAFKNYLIIGTSENNICIYDLTTMTQHSYSEPFLHTIRCIIVFNGGLNLLVSFYENYCMIIEFNNLKYYEKKNLEKQIMNCVITNDERFLLASMENQKLFVYSLPNVEKLFQITNTRFYFIALDAKNNYLLNAATNILFKYENIFNNSHPRIIGESVSYPSIKKFFNGEKNFNQGEQDSWLIFPYLINSLHFYAAENNKTALRDAMRIRKSKIINSFVGTPLDISLLTENKEVSNYIIKELAENIQENIVSLRLLCMNLSNINNKGFKSLELLYENCLVPCTFASTPIPEYCSEKLHLPKLIYSPTEDLIQEKFLNPFITGNTRVHFSKSVFKVSLETGSKESIEFLQSLICCKNQNIFKTKFIQLILNEKWNKIKWVHYSFSATFIIYLLFLSMYSLHKYLPYLYVATAANSLLSIYEIVQFLINPRIYFNDVTNYFDFLKNVFFYIYLGYRSYYMLIIASIMSWIRGVTLFTLFKRTRPLINMLYYVLQDIIPFALIVFYSILAFAFIRSTFQDDSSIGSGELILEAYFNIVGGLNTGGNGLETFLIVINSIFNVIIMLNLLISIIGKTYEGVNENELIENMKKVAELIIEVELLLLPFHFENKYNLVLVCDEYTPDTKEVEQELDDKLGNIKDSIENMKIQMLNKQENTDLEIMEIKKSITSLKQTMLDNFNTVISNMGKKKERDLTPEPTKFLCLNGHDLIIKKDSKSRICDLCFAEFRNVNDYYCYFCDFDMCFQCAQSFKSSIHAQYKCYLGHELVDYRDEGMIIDLKEFDTQTCRFCNKKFESKGFYCILCMYFVCIECNQVIEYLLNIEKPIPCKNKHILKWRFQELYYEWCLSIKCDSCQKSYLGAGFFGCAACRYNVCIRCYKRQCISL